ncbi:MAG TPA: HEAT repeat domain-containing protein [Phycisphaerae bacterium]|nr:HEAT repeat domain-containing protein [Phycisphaerae bacterium]
MTWTGRYCVPLAVMLGAVLLAPGCNSGGVARMSIDPTRAYIDAKTTLRQDADKADPGTKVFVMEAMAEVMGYEAGGVFKQALNEDNENVRFAAAMAIGDVKYEPAKPLLLAKATMYTGERDKRVYCAVLYALFRLGDTSRLSDLADLLQDPEPSVRAVAAQVMGKIGEPSAVGPLKTILADERDEGAKYNMIEALAVLGDSGSQALLESYAKGFYLDLRLAAVPAMAREYSLNAVLVLRELLDIKHPPRVRVMAAGALAELGEVSDDGYRLSVAAASRPGSFVDTGADDRRLIVGIEVASLQRLAAISLGWMKRKQAVDVLHPLLSSGDGGVRVAAAMSIMRLLADQKRPLLPPEPQPPEGRAQTPTPRPRPKLHTAGAKD